MFDISTELSTTRVIRNSDSFFCPKLMKLLVFNLVYTNLEV